MGVHPVVGSWAYVSFFLAQTATKLTDNLQRLEPVGQHGADFLKVPTGTYAVQLGLHKLLLLLLGLLLKLVRLGQRLRLSVLLYDLGHAVRKRPFRSSRSDPNLRLLPTSQSRRTSICLFV
jgi:hypothetical protein